MVSPVEENRETVEIAIIGAGLSGLGMAIRLQQADGSPSQSPAQAGAR